MMERCVFLSETPHSNPKHPKSNTDEQGVRTHFTTCISFPLLLSQSTTNLVAKNSRNLFSYSFGGPEVLNQSVSMAALPLKALEENLFFASSSFWLLLAFLCLWLHHSSSPLSSCHLFLCIFSSSVCVKTPSGSLLGGSM